jgi:hypothetical protein
MPLKTDAKYKGLKITSTTFFFFFLMEVMKRPVNAERRLYIV